MAKTMITFEITLKGFDGNTDATDHLVKWVNAPNRAALDQWLDESELNDYLAGDCPIRNLIESGCVPKGAGKEDGIDFIFGEENEGVIEDWKSQSREALLPFSGWMRTRKS